MKSWLEGKQHQVSVTKILEPAASVCTSQNQQAQVLYFASERQFWRVHLRAADSSAAVS